MELDHPVRISYFMLNSRCNVKTRVAFTRKVNREADSRRLETSNSVQCSTIKCKESSV